MAEPGAPQQESPPPVSEAVHLPGPSYLPALTALGITLALVGVVIAIPITVVGAAITIVALWRWIQAARRETAELPLEH